MTGLWISAGGVGRIELIITTTTCSSLIFCNSQLATAQHTAEFSACMRGNTRFIAIMVPLHLYRMELFLLLLLPFSFGLYLRLIVRSFSFRYMNETLNWIIIINFISRRIAGITCFFLLVWYVCKCMLRMFSHIYIYKDVCFTEYWSEEHEMCHLRFG